MVKLQTPREKGHFDDFGNWYVILLFSFDNPSKKNRMARSATRTVDFRSVSRCGSKVDRCRWASSKTLVLIQVVVGLYIHFLPTCRYRRCCWSCRGCGRNTGWKNWKFTHEVIEGIGKRTDVQHAHVCRVCDDNSSMEGRIWLWKQNKIYVIYQKKKIMKLYPLSWKTLL